MAPKRATFLSYGNDELCDEIRDFIEGSGVILKVRDIGKEPLSEDELSRLIGHLHIDHFLNPVSDSYDRLNLNDQPVDRQEIIKAMAEDHTLIRRPIIQSARLMTIGCNKKKIAEMLQISENGNREDEVAPRNHSNMRRANA